MLAVSEDLDLEDGWGGSEEVTAGGHRITCVTCHVPFSLILQCYKSLYLISENACAWVWKVSKNVSVLCTERNERALNLITVQWRNMLHVSQVIFLLSSQILLIWQYTLVSYLRNLLRDFAHPWEGIDGAVPGAVVAPLPVEMHVTCHVSRVTCHVSGLLSRCYQHCSCIIIFAIL